MTGDANPYKPPRSNLEASVRGRAPADAALGPVGETPLPTWQFEYKISATRWIFMILLFGSMAFLFGAGLYFTLTATPVAHAAHSSGRAGMPFYALFGLVMLCATIYCTVRLARGLGEAPLIVEIGEKAVRVPHPSRRGELLAIPYRFIKETVEVKGRRRNLHRLMILSRFEPATVMSIGFRSAKDFTLFKVALHERMGVKQK